MIYINYILSVLISKCFCKLYTYFQSEINISLVIIIIFIIIIIVMMCIIIIIIIIIIIYY